MNSQIKAQEAGSRITKESVETEGKQLDNAMKIGQMTTGGM
jgi:hypothetical protein